MPLQPQVAPIILRGGLSQKTDQKLVIPGKLLLLENARKLKDGRYQKRLGFDELSLASSGTFQELANVLALSTFNSDLIATTDSKLYSYSPSARQWFEKSSITSVSASTSALLRNSFEQSQVDVATSRGVQVTAYKDSRGGVYAVASDTETGAFILGETQLNASADKPCVRACGNYLYVFYIVSGTLRCRRLNPLTATAFDSEVTLVSDVNTSHPHFDVAAYGTAMIVAYNNSTPKISVFYCTQTPDVGSSLSGFPAQVVLSEAADNVLDLVVAGTTFHIAYHNSTNGTRNVILNQDLTTAHAAQTIDPTTSPITQNLTGAYNATAGAVEYFYEVHAATATNTIIKSAKVTTGGTVTTGTTLVRSVGLASKAFVYNGNSYAAIVYDSTLQGTYFVVRSDGFICAKYNAGEAGGLLSAQKLPQVLNPDTAQFQIPALVKSALLSENATLFTLRGIGVCALDFGAESTFQNAQLGGNLHFASGILQAYDGFSVVEHGFHVFPEGVTTAVQAGGSINVGTRAYKVIYQWVDNQGQVHRSAPSVAVSATTTSGNQQVQLTIPTLRLTARKGVRTNATIEVYGTESATSGTVYYKLTSTTSPLYNDTTVDSVTFTDTASDSSIISNELLYTTGEILENIAPASGTLIAVFKNRLVLAGVGDSTFWLSKPFTKGEAIGFSDSMVYPVDATGTDCSAVGILDDKLILFQPDAAFYYTGNGPNNAGANDDMSGPFQVQMDVGCPYPNSVVRIPGGLVFKSKMGIYLLTSGMQPEYIGADVEDYNGLTIESAVRLEDKQEVRFSTKEGVTLVYNYYFKEWMTHTNLTSFDAINWKGVYTILKTDSNVWTEGSSFTDAGRHIPLRVGVSWLSPAGLQGFQRVWHILGLGDYKTPHKLKISVATDFEDVFRQVRYFDTEESLKIAANKYGLKSPYGTGNYGGDGSGVYNFALHLKHQKCQSLRFVIEDVPTDDPDEAYSFTGFALHVGLKQGPARLPAVKRL